MQPCMHLNSVFIFMFWLGRHTNISSSTIHISLLLKGQSLQLPILHRYNSYVGIVFFMLTQATWWGGREYIKSHWSVMSCKLGLQLSPLQLLVKLDAELILKEVKSPGLQLGSKHTWDEVVSKCERRNSIHNLLFGFCFCCWYPTQNLIRKEKEAVTPVYKSNLCLKTKQNKNKPLPTK